MEALSPLGSSPKPGDEIHVEEPDYMYGVGPLFLRVTVVGKVERLTNGPWVNLTGIPLRGRVSNQSEGSLCSGSARRYTPFPIV
jgi:hypothetical protein